MTEEDCKLIAAAVARVRAEVVNPDQQEVCDDVIAEIAATLKSREQGYDIGGLLMAYLEYRPGR